jgi:hypothetical protein
MFLPPDTLLVSASPHIAFFDSLNGTAVIMASRKTLFRTTGDGGRNWMTMRLDSAADGGFSPLVRDLAIADPRVAYVVTDVGLYKTTDRGASWDILPLPVVVDSTVKESWVSISCTSPLNCWMVGVSGRDIGRVVHTTDGGQSWTDISLPGYKSAVSAVDSMNIYVASDREGIFFTRDGGEHWFRTMPAYPGWFHDTPSFTGIASPSVSLAHVVDSYTVFTTTDGGFTFTPDTVLMRGQANISRLSCVRSGECWGLDREEGGIYLYGVTSAVPTAESEGLQVKVVGGTLELHLSPETRGRLVEVIDMMGDVRIRKSVPDGASSLSVDITGLASGSYFFRMGSVTARFDLLR